MSIEKWESLGFLDEINSMNKKEVISKLFDDIVIMFLNNKELTNFDGEDSIIFSIILNILKIIDERKYNFDNFINFLREKLFEFHKKHDFHLDVHGCWRRIDYQAELSFIFVDEFIKNNLSELNIKKP